MKNKRSGIVPVIIAAGVMLAPEVQACSLRETPSGYPTVWRLNPKDPDKVLDLTVIVDPSVGRACDECRDAVDKAFAAWQDSGAEGLPEINVVDGSAQDTPGFHKGTKNSNTVRYADTQMPFVEQAMLGVTISSFASDGTIVDADIVMNGYDRVMGNADKNKNAFDFQGIMTHEVGHFFGLGEDELDIESTMYPTTAAGETNKRDLTDADKACIRKIYPKIEEPAEPGISCSYGGGSNNASLFVTTSGLLLAIFSLWRLFTSPNPDSGRGTEQ